MLTAAARALHREGPTPWILDDVYAAGLAGDAGAAMMDRVRARLSVDGLASFVLWVALRGRFTEDLVEDAIRDSIRQYVILGAGLDSSAYRHGAWAGRVGVFEVDHHASQAWKRARLRDLGVEVPANLVFAPVDFERETLRAALVRAGFDVSAPAVLSWMGVTMYLSGDAIAATLNDIAALAPGTRLVMTYNRPLELVDPFSRDVASGISSAVAEGGEPFVSVFEPEEADALLRSHGLVDVEDFAPEDLKLRYLGARPDIALAGAQHVLVGRVPSGRSSPRGATTAAR